MELSWPGHPLGDSPSARPGPARGAASPAPGVPLCTRGFRRATELERGPASSLRRQEQPRGEAVGTPGHSASPHPQRSRGRREGRRKCYSEAGKPAAGPSFYFTILFKADIQTFPPLLVLFQRNAGPEKSSFRVFPLAFLTAPVSLLKTRIRSFISFIFIVQANLSENYFLIFVCIYIHAYISTTDRCWPRNSLPAALPLRRARGTQGSAQSLFSGTGQGEPIPPSPKNPSARSVGGLNASCRDLGSKTRGPLKAERSRG